MKKSVYNYTAHGSKFSIDLEILMDINRELTETDDNNLRNHVEKIVRSIHEESINLDPQSKINTERERKEILSLFGNRTIFVEEIPNGYCPDYCCKHLPWFIVTTNKGRIKIGWRKRVININWSDSVIKHDSEKLFPAEDVTKFDKAIHAWNLEKAKEYIDILLNLKD
jgi:hypothetical protein